MKIKFKFQYLKHFPDFMGYSDRLSIFKEGKKQKFLLDSRKHGVNKRVQNATRPTCVSGHKNCVRAMTE